VGLRRPRRCYLVEPAPIARMPTSWSLMAKARAAEIAAAALFRCGRVVLQRCSPHNVKPIAPQPGAHHDCCNRPLISSTVIGEAACLTSGLSKIARVMWCLISQVLRASMWNGRWYQPIMTRFACTFPDRIGRYSTASWQRSCRTSLGGSLRPHQASNTVDEWRCNA